MIHNINNLPRAIAIFAKKPNGRKFLPFDFRTLKFSTYKGYFPSVPGDQEWIPRLKEVAVTLNNKLPGIEFKVGYCNSGSEPTEFISQ